jgi:hypothetical protein
VRMLVPKKKERLPTQTDLCWARQGWYDAVPDGCLVRLSGLDWQGKILLLGHCLPTKWRRNIISTTATATRTRWSMWMNRCCLVAWMPLYPVLFTTLPSAPPLPAAIIDGRTLQQQRRSCPSTALRMQMVFRAARWVVTSSIEWREASCQRRAMAIRDGPPFTLDENLPI